ncbi:MAG: hypothetical protein LC104_00600, partial [Bacteroidales bacterium]|nr:hypothetical protein [Bacteroidales bacterium]
MRNPSWQRRWLTKIFGQTTTTSHRHNRSIGRHALIGVCQELEQRVVPVAPGSFSGLISTDTQFDQAGTYTITGNLTIANGAHLTVSNGAILHIQNNVQVQVNGELSFVGTSGSPMAVTIDEGQYGGDYVNQGITVAGTLNAEYAQFTINNPSASHPEESYIQISSGGQLTATHSQFGWDATAWDGGSILSAGTVTGNTFASSVYTPAGNIPKLTNNDSFKKVYLLSTGSIGTSLTLSPLGTVDNTQNQYVINGHTAYGVTAYTPLTIASGSSLTFSGGARVEIEDDVQVQVNGGLSFVGTSGSPMAVTIDEGQYGGDYVNQGITVAGTLNAEYAQFTINNPSASHPEESYIQISSGGQLTATHSQFGWDATAWDGGSILSAGTVTGNTFASSVYTPAGNIPKLTNNDSFKKVYLLSTGSIGTSLTLSPLGTVDNTQNQYVINGHTAYGVTAYTPLTIASGSSLTFSGGARVEIEDDVQVQVNGGLSFVGTSGSPMAVTIDEGQYGGDYVNQGITVAGTLNAEYAQFTINNPSASHPEESYIQISSGGQLTATHSQFGWDATAWDGGSILSAGTVTGNTFASSVYTPAGNIPKLTNNDSFKKVYLLSTGSIGTSLTLSPLGTVDNTQNQYVINGHTAYGVTAYTPLTIASGSSLTFSGGARVEIEDDVQVQVNGGLSFVGTSGSPMAVTIDEGQYGGDYVNQGITVAGTLNAEYAQFTINNPSASHPEESYIQINSGGSASIVSGNFKWDRLKLNAGSNSVIEYVLFDGKLTADSATASAIIAQNDFSSTHALVEATGTAGTTVDARNNYWGSPITETEIQTLHVTDVQDNATVLVSPFLDDRPVRSETVPIPPVPYTPNTGGSTQIDLTTYLTTTTLSGIVNNGSVTFTVKLGGTVIGTPVTTSVTGGVAQDQYTIPSGTPAGTYTVEVVYTSSGGTVYTDTSAVLVVQPIAQTVSFTAPTPVTYSSGLVVNLSGTSSSGLPVSYVVISGPATIAGNVLSITGAGTVVIEARQTGDGNYNPATAVQQSLVVNLASQTITFSAPAPVTYSSGLTVNLSGTSSSGLPVSYVVISGPATVTGNVLSITGAGTV